MQTRTAMLAIGLVLASVSGNKTMAQSVDAQIPFELRSEYLIVARGSIGELQHLSFLVDTGTTYTTVDKKVADRLALRRKPGRVVHFDRTTDIEWAEVAEIEMGPLKAQKLEVMVMELQQLSEFAEGLDVIVGLDLLRAAEDIHIDYARQMMTVKQPLHSGQRVEEEKRQALIVSVVVQGRALHLIFDTGLKTMTLYSDRLSAHHLDLSFDSPLTHARSGQIMGASTLLSGVQMGSKSETVPLFLIPKAPGSLASTIDGYLGPMVMHAHIVDLDFRSSKLSWQ